MSETNEFRPLEVKRVMNSFDIGKRIRLDMVMENVNAEQEKEMKTVLDDAWEKLKKIAAK